jgi:hypothetical protein
MLRKTFPFSSKTDEDPFKEFTEQPEVSVVRVETIDGSPFTTVLYYEYSGDLTQVEHTKLTWIREKADQVAQDEDFGKLSNMKQREFYLLEKYTLNSNDARDVCEYLNMRNKLINTPTSK